MAARIVLALPDSKRIGLLRDPTARRRWLETIANQDSALLDWESWKITDGDTLACLALDLAAAELILKLPPGVHIACAKRQPALRLRTSRYAMLDRAASRVNEWLPAPGPLDAPEPWLASWLEPLRSRS